MRLLASKDPSAGTTYTMSKVQPNECPGFIGLVEGLPFIDWC